MVIGLLVACYLASGLCVYFALWRAQVCLEARQHEQALMWLNGVGWMRPRNAELHYLLAKANRRLGRFPEVERHLQRAVDLGWNRQDLEREQWIAQAQTGQYAAMNSHWSDLFLNAGADGPEICRAFVIASLKRFQVADASRVIAGWKADFPDDPEPYFHEARIAAVALRWRDAETAYREALKRASERKDIREGLIESLLKQLKFAEADRELKQLLQRDPGNLAAQVNRADCLIRLGSLDEARKLLQSIMKQDASQYQALVLLGQLETADVNSTEAVKALEHAVAIHSEDAETRYLYAKALRAAGRDADAAEHFQYRESAKEPLIRLNQATVELVAAPRNLALRYEVGELTWRWRSHEEGAAWLLSLLEFDPSHRPTHALLARHYELLGNNEKAKRHRELAGSMEFHE